MLNIDDWTLRDFVASKFKEIREAESKGKRELKLMAPHKMSGLKSEVGSTIHWQTNSSVIPIKKPWTVKSAESVNGGIEVTIERLDEKYWKFFKNKTITHRELINLSDIEHFGLLKAGTLLITDDGNYAKIENVTIEEEVDYDLSHKNKKANPHRFHVMKDVVVVYVREEVASGRHRTSQVVFDEKVVPFDLEKFDGRYILLRDRTFEEFEERVKQVKDEQTLAGFEDNLMIGNNGENSTSLVGFNSKDQLMINRSQLRERESYANSVAAGINREIALKREEMEQQIMVQQQKVAIILSQVNKLTTKINKEVGKIETLVSTLEIYSGVKESILQIKSGENAPETTPVSIRSLVLYMDEEVAVTKDQGIDSETIDIFDEWIADNQKAIDSLLPEKKGVVLLRPRRHMKDRRELPPIIRMRMEDLDKMCYILIRNGQNVYRIWTDNIEIQHQLLPNRDELQGVFDQIYVLEKIKSENEPGSYDYRNADEKIDSLETGILYYKRILILLQGIVMRTEIFKPLPPKLNLLDISTHGDAINFIYDHEFTLGDGRPSFDEWRKKMNHDLVKGQRIYFVDDTCPSANNFPNRFSLQWQHKESAPPTPNSGVYSLKHGEDVVTRDVTKIIPRTEYDEEVKRWEAVKKKYTTSKLDGHETKTVTKIPKHEFKTWKFNLDDRTVRFFTTKGKAKDGHMGVASWSHSGDSKAWDLVEVNEVVDEITEKHRHYGSDANFERKNKRITETIPCFKISYNPKDKVYATWGKSFDNGDYERERKAPITMKIYKNDKFILNFDAMLLEDIEYYLNDRQHRGGYLDMMPVLRGIKEELIREHKEEKAFAEALAERLFSKIEGKIEKTAILQNIWGRVKWWKDELVTVWKRPLSKDEGKAWSTIELHVLRDLQKDTKSDFGATLDNRKKTLMYQIYIAGTHHTWIGTGFHKSQFVEGLWKEAEFIWIAEKRKLTKTGVQKKVSMVDVPEMVELAATKPGEIYYYSK